MAKQAPPWEELSEDQQEAIRERLRQAVAEELERLRKEAEAKAQQTGS
ncbi:MAG: hypothetical protein IT190_07380 [Microbacteriaceae bacterium]|nr:hypothetical protein [Microbacteriaceae bacterium]